MNEIVRKSKKTVVTQVITVLVIMSIGMLGMGLTVQAANAKTAMSKKKINITAGNSVVLNLKNNTKKVKWSTSKKSVVAITYKKGNRVVLRGLKKGSANITAKVGKKKYTCKVTVKKAATFPKKLTVTVGTKIKFGAGKAKWSSSNTTVLKLYSKTKKTAAFKAVKAGTAEVRCVQNGLTFICRITVLEKMVMQHLRRSQQKHQR